MTALNPSQFRPLRGSGAAPGPGRGRKFSKSDEAVIALAGRASSRFTAGQPKAPSSKIPKEDLELRRIEHGPTAPPPGVVEGRDALKSMVPGAQVRRRIGFERKNTKRFEGDVLTHPEVVSRGIKDRGEAYRALGWQETESERLKGVANLADPNEPDDPGMLDLPDRWEDIHPKQQQRILRTAADYGITPDSLRLSFGTQLDRAMAREGGRHASFYEVEGTSATGDLLPRTVLNLSAEKHGVSHEIVSSANAITSPRVDFMVKPEGKPTQYPNAEAADLAIHLAKEGRTGAEYLANPDAYPTTRALHKNVARAVDVVGKLLQGTPIREAWKPGGQPGSGSDKVRAYYNAWRNPRLSKGQFFVSDVHSGGYGMAPHLTKPERESYLSTAGVHALHDKIVRDLLQERGLTNVSRAQSAQWNQSKYEQNNKGQRAAAEGMVRGQ